MVDAIAYFNFSRLISIEDFINFFKDEYKEKSCKGMKKKNGGIKNNNSTF